MTNNQARISNFAFVVAFDDVYGCLNQLFYMGKKRGFRRYPKGGVKRR